MQEVCHTAVFAEGSGRLWIAALPADTLKAMLTVNGGEKMAPESLHPEPTHR